MFFARHLYALCSAVAIIMDTKWKYLIGGLVILAIVIILVVAFRGRDKDSGDSRDEFHRRYRYRYGFPFARWPRYRGYYGRWRALPFYLGGPLHRYHQYYRW